CLATTAESEWAGTITRLFAAANTPFGPKTPSRSQSPIGRDEGSLRRNAQRAALHGTYHHAHMGPARGREYLRAGVRRSASSMLSRSPWARNLALRGAQPRTVDVASNHAYLGLESVADAYVAPRAPMVLAPHVDRWRRKNAAD